MLGEASTETCSFDTLKFVLRWRSVKNILVSHFFLISFRLFRISAVWNVENLEKPFVPCWQIYFSGFLSTLFQQFTSLHQKLTIKAITCFSFPTFSLFSASIILSKFHVFLVVFYYTWHRCYYFQKNPTGSLRTNPLAWGWHQKTDLSSLLVGESIILLSGIIWKES